MSNADRIGLPSFIGWFVNSGPWTALILAWCLTPIGLYIVAYILESRLVGRDFRPFVDAFLGFMPGDLFLGAAFGCFVWAVDRSPGEQGWWASSWWHLVVFIGAIVGGLLARKFLDSPNYTRRQMRSPSKLYHDVALYMGYGYMFTTTAIAALAHDGWSVAIYFGLVCVALWIACLIADIRMPARTSRRFANKAHPKYGWDRPIWK